MSTTFFVHVNNHVNRKSFRKMTSSERKKTRPSYTVVGILEGDTLKFGVAVCSKEDMFCKETGRQIALKNVTEESKVTIPAYAYEMGIGNYFVAKARKIVQKRK